MLNLRTIFVSVALVAAIVAGAATVAIRLALPSGLRPEPVSASARPAVYADLNALEAYRASEWDLPRPAAGYSLNALSLYRASEWGRMAVAAPSVADLNKLTLYRASEWGMPASRPVPFHDLLIVK